MKINQCATRIAKHAIGGSQPSSIKLLLKLVPLIHMIFFWTFLSFLTSLLLPKCPCNFLYHRLCTPTRDLVALYPALFTKDSCHARLCSSFKDDDDDTYYSPSMTTTHESSTGLQQQQSQPPMHPTPSGLAQSTIG